MTKIYAQGNYIVIEANNERKTFQKKGVGFEIVNYDGLYSLNDKGLPIGDFNYSDVKKEDGSGYATPLEFEKFLFENTGNFNSGADVSPKVIGSLKALEDGLATKLDKGTYTGTASDLKSDIDGKANSVDVSAVLALKADKSTTYTKSEVDTKLEEAIYYSIIY